MLMMLCGFKGTAVTVTCAKVDLGMALAKENKQNRLFHIAQEHARE
jgi:hypothetical protein